MISPEVAAPAIHLRDRGAWDVNRDRSQRVESSEGIVPLQPLEPPLEALSFKPVHGSTLAGHLRELERVAQGVEVLKKIFLVEIFCPPGESRQLICGEAQKVRLQ